MNDFCVPQMYLPPSITGMLPFKLANSAVLVSELTNII